MRDRGIKTLLAAVVIGLASMGSAQSVTVGDFTFDESAFAKSAIVKKGKVGPLLFDPILGFGGPDLEGNIVDRDLISYGPLDNGLAPLDNGGFGSVVDVIEVGFAKDLIDHPDADLLIFERFSAADSPRVALSEADLADGGDFITGVLPSANIVMVDGEQINIFEFDLGLLTLPVGGLGNTLFLSWNGMPTEIAEIAAGDFGPAVVPLPAALPLFAGGLGLLGLLGWRRKRAASA